nr:hypothetical protein [Tanacetum cinerariifolium]
MEAPSSPDYIPGPKAPPSPDYIPGPEAPPSPDYIPGPEYPEYLPPADDVLPAEEQPLPAAVSPTAESPGYITESKHKMEPEEEDGDDEKSEEDSIDEEEEEEHLALTVPTPALYSSIPAFEDSDETKPFEEGETAAIPSPFGYRVAARISVQPHILMPFRSDESIPEADILLRKRARFTTPTGGYEVGESSVAVAARQIRPALTIANRRRADDRLIGRLRREMRYFHTLSTTYAQEVAYSRDYCTQIMDYCKLREVHTSTIVTQMEALQRDVTMAEAEASRVRNGYGSNGSGPRLAQAVRECTYLDFLKCQPLNFKGTEGVIRLTQSLSYMVELPCEDCYSGSCSGIAVENFKENDDRQELALMCDRTFPEESDRVEKYIGGVPDTIHDSVKATKPKTMQEAIKFATELIDKRIRDAVENKQKFEGTSGNNQNQPQQNKRQNTGRANAARNSNRNMYTGPKPLCSKCDYHHEGPCPPRRATVAMSAELKDTLKKLP